ncbi:protein adenylyltransferase SelO-like [Penaeus monodon]|uniref:protein adenylyltransferase SelO-like n=1 Tax=Penaeus monodon TaxID=6687 RepID=UPI0018A6D6DD|nr:protein adenylyltransferase SelO-like [Penaeus monodon]
MSGLKILITNSVLFSLQRGLCQSLAPKTYFRNTKTLTQRGVCPNEGFLKLVICSYEGRNYCSLIQGQARCSVRAMEGTSSATEVNCASGSEARLYRDVTSEDWKLSSEEFLKFPLDPEEENYVRRNVLKSVFSIVHPTPLEGQTALAGVSARALDVIDLHFSVASSTQFRDFASGGWIHPRSTPLAHRYGGHQFGWWAEQLGDGRAHLLGHYVNRKGSWWELQLKGSGKTPYSRAGDGRAVIRSSVREFLAAEAMAALGFRTSRSASIVVGEELALRDQFYNGNLKMEKMAVVLRLAPTWFRFGSLEILARRNETEILQLLVDHIIEKHFRSIAVTDPDRYLSLFSKIVEETAEMIAQWQSVGFTHGVMNTDNMSVASVTIDYGPFGFLDTYDPDFIPNSSDDEGMYSYKNQPKVGYYNLHRLADALRPLLSPSQVQQIKHILPGFHVHFQTAYLQLFARKLGLQNSKTEDEILVQNLLDIMKDSKADFTMTFWEFGNLSLEEIEANNVPRNFWSLPKILNHYKFDSFLSQYKLRLQEENSSEETRQSIMASANPRYILRNWIAQQVIEKVEQGSYSELDQVLNILNSPFSIQPIAEKKGLASSPPKWSKTLRVSCSS